MAKCYITGVELNVSKGYVLDISSAQRTLRNMRERVASLERLIQQLSPHDDTEVYDAKKHKHITMKYRRLVSAQVAAALSAACPEETIFISWEDWLSRRREIMAKYFKKQKLKKITPSGPDGEPSNLEESGDERKEECHATGA